MRSLVQRIRLLPLSLHSLGSNRGDNKKIQKNRSLRGVQSRAERFTNASRCTGVSGPFQRVSEPFQHVSATVSTVRDTPGGVSDTYRRRIVPVSVSDTRTVRVRSPERSIGVT